MQTLLDNGATLSLLLSPTMLECNLTRPPPLAQCGESVSLAWLVSDNFGEGCSVVYLEYRNTSAILMYTPLIAPSHSGKWRGLAWRLGALCFVPLRSRTQLPLSSTVGESSTKYRYVSPLYILCSPSMPSSFCRHSLTGPCLDLFLTLRANNTAATTNRVVRR